MTLTERINKVQLEKKNKENDKAKATVLWLDKVQQDKRYVAGKVLSR